MYISMIILVIILVIIQVILLAAMEEVTPQPDNAWIYFGSDEPRPIKVDVNHFDRNVGKEYVYSFNFTSKKWTWNNKNYIRPMTSVKWSQHKELF